MLELERAIKECYWGTNVGSCEGTKADIGGVSRAEQSRARTDKLANSASVHRLGAVRRDGGV